MYFGTPVKGDLHENMGPVPPRAHNLCCTLHSPLWLLVHTILHRIDVVRDTSMFCDLLTQEADTGTLRDYFPHEEDLGGRHSET